MFTPTAQERLFADLTADIAGYCIPAETTSCAEYLQAGPQSRHCLFCSSLHCLIAQGRAFKIMQAVRQDLSDRCALPPETQRVVQEMKLTSGGVSNPRGTCRLRVLTSLEALAEYRKAETEMKRAREQMQRSYHGMDQAERMVVEAENPTLFPENLKSQEVMR